MTFCCAQGNCPRCVEGRKAREQWGAGEEAIKLMMLMDPYEFELLMLGHGYVKEKAPASSEVEPKICGVCLRRYEYCDCIPF